MNYEDIIKQAKFHYKKREHSQVITFATQAIESAPERVEGYFWRASTFNRIHAFDVMQKDADDLLTCTPSTALHYAYRGFACCVKKEKNSKQAVEECSKALQQDDSVKEAYYYRAVAYNDLNEVDYSIVDCNKALVLDPEYAAIYNLRGSIYGKKNNFDLAIADYNKAIEIDPTYDTAYNNRGVEYQTKGYFNLAIKDYNESIKLNPESSIAKNNLKNVYRKRESKINLLKIRNNQKYMDELKESIEKVVPFLGAGVSIPYGYYSWRTLLLNLLERCDHIKIGDIKNEKEKIARYIEEGRYIDAANEMDNIFANLSSTVSHMIERIATAKPISMTNSGLLGEYLHLFPSAVYLTTNYDKVVEDVLKLQEDWSVEPIVATLNKADQIRMNFTTLRKKAIIYYLHGIFTEPNSITLSGTHYDDYYGIENNIKSNLRRFLPKELRRIHNDYAFLFIGCSMLIREDRILRLLRNFYGNLQNYPRSYALLNANEVAGSKMPFESWEILGIEEQNELNKKLKEKEDELEDMNVRIIWYSAPIDNKHEPGMHESAKHELFEYILREPREKKELKRNYDLQKWEQNRIAKEKEKFEKEEKIKEQWQHAEDMPCRENIDESEITALQIDSNENIFSEEKLKQLKNSIQDEISITEINPTKYAIKLPMYKIEGGLYQISLLFENGKYYLSDGGATYADLDKIFELKEPDVVKNLIAILRQYGCRRQLSTNSIIIDCTLQDVHIKMSYLIQAISFMLNMKIFYV